MITHSADRDAVLRHGERLVLLCTLTGVLLMVHCAAELFLVVGSGGDAIDGLARWIPAVLDAAAAAVVLGVAGLVVGQQLPSQQRRRLAVVVLGVALLAAGARGALHDQPWQVGEIAVLVVVAGTCALTGRAYALLASTAWAMVAVITGVAALRGHVDGEVVTMLVSVGATLAAATAGGVVTTRALTLQRTAATAALEQALAGAVRDPLTGAANRQGLDMVASPIIDYARRQGQALHCLVVDIDAFSAVNESNGRDGGDAVLVAVSRALLESVRGTDVVARWRDDRFVVFGPGGGTSPVELERRVHSYLKEAPLVLGQSWSERVSIGSATLVPWDEGDLDSLLARGEKDLGLRRALRKRAGLVRDDVPAPADARADQTTALD